MHFRLRFMGYFPCEEYEVQFKCIWQASSNRNMNYFLHTSMKVSINIWENLSGDLNVTLAFHETQRKTKMWISVCYEFFAKSVACQPSPRSYIPGYTRVTWWPRRIAPATECRACRITTQGYFRAWHSPGPRGKYYRISSSQGICPPSSLTETFCCRGRLH